MFERADSEHVDLGWWPWILVALVIASAMVGCGDGSFRDRCDMSKARIAPFPDPVDGKPEVIAPLKDRAGWVNFGSDAELLARLKPTSDPATWPVVPQRKPEEARKPTVTVTANDSSLTVPRKPIAAQRPQEPEGNLTPLDKPETMPERILDITARVEALRWRADRIEKKLEAIEKRLDKVEGKEKP